MGIDRRATVLIVEDDPITSLNERETLEEAGYSVITTRTGEAGVKVACTVHPLDIIIMDINLGPGMNGLEAASTILQSVSIPLLFVTARSDQSTLQDMASIPAYGLIHKDCSNELLVASVGMALRRVTLEKETAGRHAAEAAKLVTAAVTRLREAHHRVRNNIASIKAIMNMQLDASACQETVDALQDDIARLEGMSALYDMLAIGGSDTNIAIEPYMASLVDTILPIFPFSSNVDVKMHVADVSLDPKRTFALGIITNELITNIMKYAFTGKESGSIRINIEAYDESIIMTIRDDGIGLPDSFDPVKCGGLGLSLISMLLEQFTGTLTMRNDKGAVSTVLLQAPGLKNGVAATAASAVASTAAHQNELNRKTATA